MRGPFLLMLDSTIVALALPAIQRDLDASTIGLQWVMNAYLLTITVLVVPVGRLGDMFGRRWLESAASVLTGANSRSRMCRALRRARPMEEGSRP